MPEKKIHPYKIKKLGMDYGGKPVVMQSFRGKFTQEEITNYVQNKSNTYKNKGMNFQIQTTVRWNPSKRGWRSGTFTNVGDEVDFYEDKDWYEDAPAAPDHFPEFRVYLVQN